MKLISGVNVPARRDERALHCNSRPTAAKTNFAARSREEGCAAPRGQDASIDCGCRLAHSKPLNMPARELATSCNFSLELLEVLPVVNGTCCTGFLTYES